MTSAHAGDPGVPLPPAPRRFAGSAAVTAILQIAAMGIGGVIAVLVVSEFGKTPRTDGVFVAYGIYGLIYVLAATLRTTVVPRLAEADSLHVALDRYIAGALLVFAAGVIPLVLLGGPLASLLTGSLPHRAEDAAESALAIFWLASGAHLLAALAAAALAVRTEFALPGLAYVAGGALSVVLLVALSDSLGTDAVPVSLAAGGALSAAILFARLAMLGYRPGAELRPRREARGAAVLMVVGAVPQLIAQVMYAISLAFAARLAAGAVTLYSYAFFAALLVIGATTFPASIVLAAPLAQDWDRRPESLTGPLLDVFRAGLVLVAPVIALAALCGDELIELVLGGSLSAHDADSITGTFLVLGGIVVTSIATVVPMLAAFAAGRYTRLMAFAAVTASFHVLASLAVAQADRIQALAAVASIDSVLFLALLLHMTWGRAAWGVGGQLLRELAAIVVAAGLAFAPFGAVAAAVGSGAAEVVAWLLGLGAFVAILAARLPDHWLLARRMAEPVLGARRLSSP